jgi:hypothetical protein
MSRVIRNIVAVVLGLLVGSAINMSLIMVSGKVIPPPPGADVTTMEGLKASLPLFEPRHFLFPFLAHALGTLVGAAVAWMVAVSPRSVAAYVVGGCFLLGGLANVLMLPAPLWFDVVDLVFAYLPMAWLASRLASRISA